MAIFTGNIQYSPRTDYNSCYHQKAIETSLSGYLTLVVEEEMDS